MMIAQLIKSAADQGVHLYVKDETLHFDLSVAQFPLALKQHILQHKPQIIAFLRGLSQVSLRPVLQAVPDTADYLPSFSQQRFWLLEQMQQTSGQYHMPLAFHVCGPAKPDLLEQVFQTIVQRHQILSTSYHEQNGALQAQIRPQVSFRLNVHDLHAETAPEQAERLHAALQQAISCPFDLGQDLLLRGWYFRLNSAVDSTQQGILLLVMHHIAFDGWSVDVFIREFSALYTAFSAQQPSPLAALPVQYSDYARWQHQLLTDEITEQQLQYWRETLQDCPTLHSLQLQHERPTVKQTAGRQLSASLPASLAKPLLELARASQLSSFMLLHSALVLVLARHSNSRELIVGVPVANRPDAQLAGMLGCFVNMLVLRVNTAHATVADYLAHVKAVHLQAQLHQDVPFEWLVEQLKVPRSGAYSPLFQIALSSTDQFSHDQLSGQAPLAVADLTLSRFEEESVQLKFDLELDFALTETGVSIVWNYDVALFSHDYISQLNTHFCQVLQALAGYRPAELDQVSLAGISILGPELELYLKETVQQTPISFAADSCLQQLFEAQVAKTPDRTALQFGSQSLSYRELNERANQLAHYLRQHYQPEPDQLIGLCTSRSAEMIIGTLAILKAGCAYVPLDPNYPPERLNYMLRDSAVRVVLTDADTPERLIGGSWQHLCLRGDDAVVLTDYPITNITPDQTGQTATSLAYAIYTSGSTGQPKGVLLQHRGLVNLAMNESKILALDADSRVLHFASMSFDAGTWEYMMALLHGGVLCIADSMQRLSPEAISTLMYEQRITHALLPPAFLAMMPLRQDLSLRCLIVGGEACDAQLMQRWAAHYPFYNAYGPTEISVCATIARCQPNEPLTIGRPLHNVSTYVLDDRLALLPPGVAGELYIGGPGVARGYLNLPELTTERFLPNPYDATGQGLLYKTGDLVRYLPDGQIDYVGRLDEQIKIRGFRIELSEIERQLCQEQAVTSAVVLTFCAGSGQRQLVAYLQLSPEVAAQVVRDERLDNSWLADLKNRLLTFLPDYMVPFVYVPMHEWPLTANGKINKKALPEPASYIVAHHYVAPATPTEKALVRIWAALLNIAPADISTTGNFFALGGHSLLLTRMVQSIRTDEAIALTDISMQDIVASKDLAALAASIDLLSLRQLNAMHSMPHHNHELVEDGEI